MAEFKLLLSSWILWFGIFLAVALGVLITLVLGRETESLLTEELLKKEQTIARANASNLTSYFQTIGNSVATLAQLDSIVSRDESTIRDMDAFVEQHKNTGIIGGVVLTDEEGIVEFNSNVLGTRDIGDALSDREPFIWARDEARLGEYLISEPIIGRLGASEEQTIVVVASRVEQNGEFAGVMAASIRLAPLTERFLGLMKISGMTEIYLFDENGGLLYSNSETDVIGSYFSTLFLDDQSINNAIGNVLSTDIDMEGYLQTEGRLVAYSPVKLGAQTWLMVISSPLEEASDIASPFYIRQDAVLAVIGFSILLLAVIAIRKNQPR